MVLIITAIIAIIASKAKPMMHVSVLNAGMINGSCYLRINVLYGWAANRGLCRHPDPISRSHCYAGISFCYGSPRELLNTFNIFVAYLDVHSETPGS